MSDGSATALAPPRKRETWSIRRIAEDIGGRPLSDFQGSGPSPTGPPGHGSNRPTTPPLPVQRPGGPGVSGTSAALSHGTTVRPGSTPTEAETEPDPVDRVYPPLTRGTGRALHGSEHEHHAETLERVRADPDPPEPGRRSYPPGPSARPERIYLHYLLLHLDRLSDHALQYLERAVNEETEHRLASAK
ncbi:MAG: hypothetical protein L3J93_04175 [Thermoplasmata archaeon]|nr:hypothetical protein [Thermoplasmata archaeon]